jgi:hypothetical protein
MRYFREGGPTPSLVESWRIMTAQYRLVPDWLSASAGAPGEDGITWLSEPTSMYDTVVPVLLVPIVLAAVALWRHSARPGRALVGVWAVAWVVGFVATVRTIGPVFAYRLGWVWVLGMLGGLMALWAGWELLVRRRGAGAERLLVPAALVVLAGLGTANTVSALTAGVPDGYESDIIAELGPEVRRWLPEGDGVVMVTGTSFGSLGHVASVRLDLERHGVDVRVPDGAEAHGRPRTYTGQPVRAQLLVGIDGDVARALTRPELELVAHSGELSPRELRALGERRAELEARLRSGELAVDEYSRQAARLNPQQVAVAVFALRVPGP